MSQQTQQKRIRVLFNQLHPSESTTPVQQLETSTTSSTRRMVRRKRSSSNLQ